MRTRPSPPAGLIYIADSPSGPGIASRLGITPGTVRKWRMKQRGPSTFMLAGRVAARIEAVDEYLRALEQGDRGRAVR